MHLVQYHWKTDWKIIPAQVVDLTATVSTHQLRDVMFVRIMLVVVVAVHLVAIAIFAILAIDSLLRHFVSDAINHTATTAIMIKMFALDVSQDIESGPPQITIARNVHLFVIPATRIKIYVHPAFKTMKYSKSMSKIK